MAGTRTSVRLVGVPPKHQGTHDSLCAYYAAAMMLSALRPELEESFECGDVRKDPLFGHYPRPGKQRLEALVADWIVAGADLGRLGRALDRVCRGGIDTRFTFETRPRTAATLAFLRAQVDAGLPCVLGWESREMGLHTVCVVGYERYSNGGDWLRVIDPARIQDLLEWSQLQRLATRRLEVIHCRAHAGLRPDKLTTVRRSRTKSTLERWDPRHRRWDRLA
jgi:hypothetical protein